MVVLDNSAAVIENGDQHSQLFVGSLVQVGACWKLIDMPRHLVAEQPIAESGFFFQLPQTTTSPDAGVPMGLSEAEEEIVKKLELVDRQLVRGERVLGPVAAGTPVADHRRSLGSCNRRDRDNGDQQAGAKSPRQKR